MLKIIHALEIRYQCLFFSTRRSGQAPADRNRLFIVADAISQQFAAYSRHT